MRIWSIIIILTFYFDSCSSTNENKSIDGKIIGQWNTESCLPHFVHAVISVQLADTLEIPKHRIKTNFSINFKQDNLFSFDNENGPTKTGKYKITDSSLTLTLNDDSFSWLTFGIDSVTDNNLFLTSKSIQFYSNTTDSLDLFTGDKVVLIMKRK
jgi:hypothetical protein